MAISKHNNSRGIGDTANLAFQLKFADSEHNISEIAITGKGIAIDVTPLK